MNHNLRVMVRYFNPSTGCLHMRSLATKYATFFARSALYSRSPQESKAYNKLHNIVQLVA